MATATARLNMRVNPEAQQMIAEAAAAQGTDITSFVVEAATTKARRILLEERALRVTPAEAIQIQLLLESDEPLPESLRRAADRLRASGE